MSSAIEVLKNWKIKMAKKVNIAFTQEEYNALGVALLALEQKERLKEWLEKEIAKEHEMGFVDTDFQKVLSKLKGEQKHEY